MAYNINDKNNICTLVKNYTLPWFWKCSHDDFQSFESLKLRKLSLKIKQAQSRSKNAVFLTSSLYYEFPQLSIPWIGVLLTEGDCLA